MGMNLSMDVSDYKYGRDVKFQDSYFPIGPYSIKVEKISPDKVFLISMISFLISISLGFVVLFLTKRFILLIYGAFALFFSYSYLFPPFEFYKKGVGEISTFFNFGPGIFLGSYVLQGGVPGISEILISISLGLVIVAILHGNNWRDMDDDLKAGVRTVANILGEKGSMFYYLSLIWLSYPLLVLAVYFNPKFFPILGSFLTIPRAVKLTKIALNNKNWNRNLLDVLTANFTALHMYFSVGLMLIYIILQHFL